MANTKHGAVIARGIIVLMVTVYMLSYQGIEGEPVSDEKYSNLKHKGTVKTIVSEEDVIDCVDFYQQPAFDNPLIKNSIQYVEASADIGQYHGAKAVFSVWNPVTEPDDFSLSQLWIVSRPFTMNLNSIEAGWIVYPNRYEDSLTRFFIYWTSDNYQATGCYDLDCTGFVQTDTTFAIGGIMDPVSVYDGEQIGISISVYKNPHTGYWWLEVGDTPVGYWPSTIFTSLATAATRISWGGEVLDAHPSAGHTTTQMGSGHFASEGFGKSSYFTDIATMDTSGTLRYTNHINQVVTNHACYDIQFDPSKIPITFYYGGPGVSPNCR